jgi:hypothetical protein
MHIASLIILVVKWYKLETGILHLDNFVHATAF